MELELDTPNLELTLELGTTRVQVPPLFGTMVLEPLHILATRAASDDVPLAICLLALLVQARWARPRPVVVLEGVFPFSEQIEHACRVARVSFHARDMEAEFTAIHASKSLSEPRHLAPTAGKDCGHLFLML